jgi:hypothetical protein
MFERMVAHEGEKLKMTREKKLEILEAIIDADGLPAMLEMLSEICADKAEHIKSAWQDYRLARQWECAAVSIAAFGDQYLMRAMNEL